MRDLVGVGASPALRRSMQRRLKKLMDAGLVVSTGVGKGTRYLSQAIAPPQRSLPPPPPPTDNALDDDEGMAIPLSPSGAEVRHLVQRPEIERDPVSYQRQFLASYQPNVTAYLPQSVREHLQQLGAIDEQSQPAGTYARHILDRLLIDLSWSSSKLEGNTYSILDTQTLIEKGKVAEGKSAEETTMILNHKSAIEFLVEAAGDVGFNRHTLLNLHSLLADNLLDAEAIGRLRQRIVSITGTTFTPLTTPQIIDECFNEMLAKADAIKNPFEQSFFASVHLPYLQPFADVNKRVSRLAANIPFIKRNLAPISFIDVPKDIYVEAMLGVYELNRIDLARDMFIWAYERSARRYAAIQQSFGAPDEFRLRYREQLRALVSEIVRAGQSRGAAAMTIKRFAGEFIPAKDTQAFVAAVEIELIGLHEGNFARYKVRPSEYYTWKGVWEA
ncbi:MAG: Fic family protein [Terricaulis sp.]